MKSYDQCTEEEQKYIDKIIDLEVRFLRAFPQEDRVEVDEVFKWDDPPILGWVVDDVLFSPFTKITMVSCSMSMFHDEGGHCHYVVLFEEDGSILQATREFDTMYDLVLINSYEGEQFLPLRDDLEVNK